VFVARPSFGSGIELPEVRVAGQQKQKGPEGSNPSGPLRNLVLVV